MEVYKNLNINDFPNEVWKDIEGYPKYQISSFGRVKSLKGKKPKILKQRPHMRTDKLDNYISVALSKNGKKRDVYTHRLVATAFIPNPENKSQINHENGDKHDNNVSNLKWSTASENIKHAYEMGLMGDRKGENHPMARLTTLKVMEIVKKYNNGTSVSDLATEYGIRYSNVYSIVNGYTWSHITNIQADNIQEE